MVFLKNHLKAGHHLEQGIIEMARSKQTENPSKKEAEMKIYGEKGFVMLLFVGILEKYMQAQS